MLLGNVLSSRPPIAILIMNRQILRLSSYFMICESFSQCSTGTKKNTEKIYEIAKQAGGPWSGTSNFSEENFAGFIYVQGWSLLCDTRCRLLVSRVAYQLDLHCFLLLFYFILCVHILKDWCLALLVSWGAHQLLFWNYLLFCSRWGLCLLRWLSLIKCWIATHLYIRRFSEYQIVG